MKRIFLFLVLMAIPAVSSAIPAKAISLSNLAPLQNQWHWAHALRLFSNKDAQWISSTSSFRTNGYEAFEGIPNDKAAVFDIELDVPYDDYYQFEVVADDTVFIYVESANRPRTVAVNNPNPVSYINAPVRLREARARFVIELQDEYASNSGVIFSVSDSSGRILVHSSSEWQAKEVSRSSLVCEKTFY